MLAQQLQGGGALNQVSGTAARPISDAELNGAPDPVKFV